MNAAEKPKLIVLAGSTGSGKSEIAVKLAQNSSLPKIEIVSADSRQIYRGMNIGTDKPDHKFLDSIPHHLIDIVNPSDQFSSGMYCKLSRNAVNQIVKKKRLPLVVGGTGLYIRVLLGGIAAMPSGDADVRDYLHRQVKSDGLRALYEKITAIDPHRAATIDPNDEYRITRTLEIMKMGTNDISKKFKQHDFQDRPYRELFFVLNVQRQKLYKRIEDRVDRMIASGFVQEVKALVSTYGYFAVGLDTIGYRQIIEYLKNKTTLESAIALIKRDTRRYAKRQITWFRKEKQAEWIHHDPDNTANTIIRLIKRIKEFLNE